MSELITKPECSEIVRNALKDTNFDETRIKSFKVYRVSEGLVGFMGEYYKLNVELENTTKGGQTLSYFVKAVSISDENFRRDLEGVFDRETRLYVNLLGDIQKYASTKLYPECYYTRPDLLVLEDMSTQDWFHITPKEDESIEFFKIVLKKEAQLHAASIAYEVDTGVNIGDKFKDVLYEMQFNMENKWFVTGLKSIVSLGKMISKYIGTPIEEFIATKLFGVLCSSCALAQRSDVYRNVLCHRDMWSRNIFFKCNSNNAPIDCLMIDFQLTRYCPPAMDVVFFIALTTTRKQREVINEECLEYYYSTFVDIMKKKALENEIFSREEFLESCRRIELLILITKAFYAPFLEMPEGMGHKFRLEEPERFDYYMNTDREEMLLRNISKLKGYKERILEPVECLIEYLIEKLNLLKS